MSTPGILLIGVGLAGLAALLSGNLDRLLERLAGAPPADSDSGGAILPAAGDGGELPTGVGSGAPIAGQVTARAAYTAGFRGEALVTALAIARAESGWRADAVGDTALAGGPWGPSIGLWQIRCLRADTDTGRPRDCAALYGSAFNARSAFSISNGGRDWSPWTVYKTGAYRAHIGAAREAIAAAGLGATPARVAL